MILGIDAWRACVILMHMSTQQEERVPQLTLGWRLKMALGDISVQEMAEHLGVTRSTLSRWMSDTGKPPRRAYVAQWALLTGVPLTWLETGDHPTNGGPGGGQSGESTDAGFTVAEPTPLRSARALLDIAA